MSTITIDSDVLIHLKNHYPRDIFPIIWDNFEVLIEGAVVCICRFVHIELQRGNDSLVEWVNSRDGFVCDPTEEELELASIISNLFSDWVREDANAADSFVIAHVKINSHTIVSDENTALPSVAAIVYNPNVRSSAQGDQLRYQASVARWASISKVIKVSDDGEQLSLRVRTSRTLPTDG